jgi:2-iminobutanoate/2-iminopropanoate deaminase
VPSTDFHPVGWPLAGELLGLQPLSNRCQFASHPWDGDNRGMSLRKSAVSTPNAPAAIGPYSQAVKIGDLVYTSGQIPLDPATGLMVEGGIREQTTRVLENVKAVLAEASSDMQRVVKTTVFLKNMSDFAAMNEIYASYLAPEGVVAPARSTVEVARLPKDALVEIDVIAQR